MNSRIVFHALAVATLALTVPQTLSAQSEGWNTPVDRARMVRIGDTKNSTLESGDRVLGDGSYYEVWFFEARAGDRVTIAMRSSAFDTYLAVGRHNGEQLESNDDAEEGNTNSAISFTAPDNGIYVIRANSFGEGESGAYSLMIVAGGSAPVSSGTNTTMRGVLAAPVNNSRMIASGRTITSSLGADDSKLPDDSYVEAYYVQLSAGQRLSVTMRSGAFDTFLQVAPHGATEALETNDDMEDGNTDSRVELTASQGGTYVIVANSLEGGKTGEFTLEVTVFGGSSNSTGGGLAGDMAGVLGGSAPSKPASPSGGARTITLGQTVNSELSSADEKLDDDSFYEAWTFSGRAGESVTITLRSSAFDAFLQVRDGSGEVINTDDDSGAGAGGTDAQLTIVIPAGGRIVIVANTLGAGETGAYTLNIVRGG
jgi:hypothetical protein